MRLLARAAAYIGCEYHLSNTVACVFVLWAIVLGAGACSPTESASAPAEATVSPVEADLTARRTAVQRRRGSDVLPVGVDEHVPVQAGDQIDVNETGRALLSEQALEPQANPSQAPQLPDPPAEPVMLQPMPLYQGYPYDLFDPGALPTAIVQGQNTLNSSGGPWWYWNGLRWVQWTDTQPGHVTDWDVVPEPASLLLLCAGLAAMLPRRRPARRR